MNAPRQVCLTVLGAVLACSAGARADDLILTHPDYDHINASAIDQPELNAVLTRDGAVITEDGDPVILEAFVDTGASGFVVSYMNAVGYDYEPITGYGYEHVPSLGLDGSPSGEFEGYFTEQGIAGAEQGDVTELLGVKVLNGTMYESIDPDDFVDYGEYHLWVRRAVGVGEVISQCDGEFCITWVDPVNIVGMPVISRRVLTMDPTPIADLDRMVTHLLPAGDPAIPQTNVTFDLHLVDLTGEATPPETLPSTSANPLVRHVTLEHTVDETTVTVSDNEWLLDTGSGSTFISFAKAQQLGLIDAIYEDVADYLPHHPGLTAEVGGIGPGTVTTPILRLDEIRIPAKENFYVIWKNVDVMVIDVEVPTDGGIVLDGVFGLNLLVPAITADLEDPSSLFDFSPGYFTSIVFDPTDPSNVELRLFTDSAPAAILTGDMDGSGAINNNDITPFVLALTDPDGYFTQYGLHPELVGDIDGDGSLNNNDISPFVDLLTSSPAVPEPFACALLGLGAFALPRRKRR